MKRKDGSDERVFTPKEFLDARLQYIDRRCVEPDAVVREQFVNFRQTQYFVTMEDGSEVQVWTATALRSKYFNALKKEGIVMPLVSALGKRKKSKLLIPSDYPSQKKICRETYTTIKELLVVNKSPLSGVEIDHTNYSFPQETAELQSSSSLSLLPIQPCSEDELTSEDYDEVMLSADFEDWNSMCSSLWI